MVSVSKMVQSRSRTIQYILLCLFWQLGSVSPGWGQYSSMGIQQEDKGEILLFLINVVVHKIGKKLDKGYKCPLYCGVDHKHIYWEYDEDKSNQKSNLSPVNGIYHGIRDTVKEQSGSSIRPIAGIN